MATESNLITAAEHHFKVYEGDTTPAVLTFTATSGGAAINMGSASVLMEVKERPSDSVNVYVFSTAAGNIAISGGGSNVITITGWQNIPYGNFCYDLQVTIGSNVTTYLKGKIRVIKGVSE
jgi:hypothetical protein